MTQKTAPREPLIDTDGAAELLRVSRRTIEAWRLRGGGPRFVRVGRAVRYRVRDIEDWIELGERTSTSDAGTGAPRHPGVSP